MGREAGCIVPTHKDADFRTEVGALLTDCAEKNWDLGVKHVKAHRTEKEKKEMIQVQNVLG